MLVTQNLFLDDSTTFTVVECSDDAVSMQHLQPLLDTASADGVLGISATFAQDCRLSLLALSTLSRVLVVKISKSTRHTPQDVQSRIARTRSLIQDRLLLNPKFPKFAFRMDQIAVALYLDLLIRIDGAVDMMSVTTDSRHSLEALMGALGGEVGLNKKNVQSLFLNTLEFPTMDATSEVALKAWAASRAATLAHMSSRFASLARIDTKAFPKKHLVSLANISRNADRLENLKPTAVKNDVEDKFITKKGAVHLSCARFSTRIKQSKHQVIQIEIEGEQSTSHVTGRTRKVNGRSAYVNVNQPVKGDKIISVITIGRDAPTNAESVREEIILNALQHKIDIVSNPFFRALWLPDELPKRPKFKGQRRVLHVYFPRELNPSQHKAVQKVLSDEEDDRIVIIQGPPGTGKTTVIAASVISHGVASSSRNIWIAAQSNVAVKNIAEKFIKEGFYGFRLLVSKDFHYDWHEHLYDELEPQLIRSDRFKMSVVEASRLLLGCRVILCTLSMFSNPSIDVFLRIVPVEMIILDEASQIECGDYLPIFHQFYSTLSKIVFIGDDKQLPPYGQEDVPELRSVFEFPHLRKRALFLNTQYRMPHMIGAFISRNVYDGKLQTCHRLTTPRACRFIDVKRGHERKVGKSWINEEEARVVVKLAQLCPSKSFRIITPYDAQRSLIERKLKSESLLWKDKVFNVDSFQGNEDDHIIVSVVRSRLPGFLKDRRRTNVMLTRCKESMVICSSRAFLLGRGSDTLVGKLAASVGENNWIDARNGDLYQIWRRDVNTQEPPIDA